MKQKLRRAIYDLVRAEVRLAGTDWETQRSFYKTYQKTVEEKRQALEMFIDSMYPTEPATTEEEMARQ
jgi:hypothetical protein